MRLSYPTDIRIIRVPCTGKVDLVHILHAFEKGADGVCVIGCLEGDCRFKTGNLQAKKRVRQAQVILDAVGINGQKARMYNLSSAEGPKFAQFAQEIDKIVRDLGPNPIKKALTKEAA